MGTTQILVVTQPPPLLLHTGVWWATPETPTKRPTALLMIPGDIFLPVGEVDIGKYEEYTRYEWKAIFQDKVVRVWANSTRNGLINVRPLSSVDDGSHWLPL